MNEYLRNLSRIEFVVTLACTGSCIHCQNGEDLDRTCRIDPDIAKSIVEKVAGIHNISSVMTFGGEPLLYPETVCAIHSAARNVGIPRRQLITNGYFTKRAQRVEEVVRMLADAGVNELLVSADAFHQQTISLDLVTCFVKAAVDGHIPIEISPAWLVSKTDDNPYNARTRKILDELLSIEGVREGSGNIVFPGGNALKYLSEYFEAGEMPEDPYADDPHDLRALSICANGDVLDGNVYEQDILEILDGYCGVFPER